ncbi:EamA family transporter [Paraburkholderia megapolitana]|uniref:EamA family transporter n=1 Tax=Paraburkholderia megapolitana TaxID=420953 RepID=UPI0038B827E0
MISSMSGFVLLAALLHATWNAMLHGNRDRFLSMTWMSIGIASIATAVALSVPVPAQAAWPYIAVSGLVHGLYNLCLVYAYQRSDLGEAYPIARGSSPMLVALGAALFANEQIHVLQAAGIALVSCGIISFALQHRRPSRESIVAALLTGATIALYTVIDGIGVRRAGGHAISYTAWMFAFYWLMPAIFIAKRGRSALRASFADIGTSVSGGVVSIAAYGIVIWAMQYGAMGTVSALRETSVVFAVLIGRLFLREEVTFARFVSCVVIAAGAVCIGL